MAFCSLGEAALLVFLPLSSCLFSSGFHQYNFTLPVQDWISSVSLMHYGNFTPCPLCLCAAPSSFSFPQGPTEKLQLPTCSLPLQHPPDFCLLLITKPINPHTHFVVCRLALVFLSSPHLLHTAFISILKQLHISTVYSPTLPYSPHSPCPPHFLLPVLWLSIQTRSRDALRDQGMRPHCWADRQAPGGWPRDTQPSQGLSAR